MINDSERVIELYDRRALKWAGDRRQQTLLFEKGWLDRFIALTAPDGTILDLGCGFGKPIAAYLMQQSRDVFGVDSSPTMVALCRQDFPEREWRLADMRTLDLGRRFVGILAWDSFFHLTFDDQRRMFPLFAADAPLMFTSGPRHGEAIGTLRGETLYHASLDPAEYRDLLATSGFSVIDARMEDPDCGGHSVWLARRAQDR